MRQTYEIVSIQRAEPPPGVEGANWYDYVIAFEGNNTVQGCRQGSLKAVTSAVEEIVVQLNERHSKKSGRQKKT
jgi:predicted neutral ceramidase superfamily lipid hydrolase